MSENPNVRVNPDGSRWVWDGTDWNLIPAGGPAGPPRAGPPAGFPAYGAQPAWAAPAPAGRGLSIASLVLGIIGASWFLSFLVVPQVLAIVFGTVAISKAKRQGTAKGMAIAGVILGAAGILMAVGFWVIVIQNCVTLPNGQFSCEFRP